MHLFPQVGFREKRNFFLLFFFRPRCLRVKAFIVYICTLNDDVFGFLLDDNDAIFCTKKDGKNTIFFLYSNAEYMQDLDYFSFNKNSDKIGKG